MAFPSGVKLSSRLIDQIKRECAVLTADTVRRETSMLPFAFRMCERARHRFRVCGMEAKKTVAYRFLVALTD